MANYLLIAATSDIGAQVAKDLHQQGHKLWLTGRQEAAVKSVAAPLGALYSTLDATDFDIIHKLSNSWQYSSRTESGTAGTAWAAACSGPGQTAG